jgi:hypothetical protein
VKEAPDGPDWLNEIKFDGYRMHARLDRGTAKLLARTGHAFSGEQSCRPTKSKGPRTAAARPKTTK